MIFKKQNISQGDKILMLKLFFDINNWSISDILSLLSVILVIIGGLFAYKQWEYSNKIKRAEFLDQIITNLRFDREIAETINMIDYSNGWYDEYFHNNRSGLEYKVDKVLSYLSYICYLVKEKHIRKIDFVILEYEINRICLSPAVKCYLWNLYHFSVSQKSKCSFQYLIDYGIQNGLINKIEFMNSRSKKYIKRLNF